MAISSYQAYLMKGTGTGTLTYTKLVDIKEFPNLGGSPETLETTTLSDSARTYIDGLQDQEAMEFTCNYTKTDFTTLKGLEGTETNFAVWFGADSSGQPNGNNGKFSFKAKPSVYVKGSGVNEVVDMVLTLIPTTVITAE